MDINDKILEAAAKTEYNFLTTRNLKEIDTFQTTTNDFGTARIVPSEIMFSEQEQFVVKCPLSPYLSQKFHLDFPGAATSTQRPSFLHRHDFFEFNFVINGLLENYLEGKKILQGPDKFILMNPNAAHAVRIADSSTVYFNILVKKQWAEDVFTEMIAFHKNFFNFFIDSIYGLNSISPYLIFDNTPELNQQLCRLIEEFYTPKPYNQQMMVSILLGIFVILSRQSDESMQKSQDSLKKEQISHILTYLQMNYANVSLQQAAEYFNYTSGYLAQLLKKHTGKTFSEIILNYKMQSACNYLKNSELSVEKIAEVIGYYDASHLNKAFRKYQKMSPKEYRQKYSKGLTPSSTDE